MSAAIKNQPFKLQMIVFAVKYGMPYGGIRDSEPVRRDAIYGYPKYAASNCVCHTASPRARWVKFMKKKIEPKTSVKFLGVLLDSNLRWKFHINELSKKIV